MDIEKELLKFEQDCERKEALEHRDTLLAIAAILKTKEGLQIFSYLFKSLDVAILPERGMDGNQLQDYLGFLRAGNSIYKLVCEADHNIAANILAKIERERYEYIYNKHRIENGLNRSSNSDE